MALDSWLRSRRARRAMIALWASAVVVGGLGLNAWLALRPAALEARFREALAEQLVADFEIEGFEAGLARGIEARGIVLRQPDGPGREIARCAHLRVVPRWGALLGGSFRASRVELRGLHLRLAREAGGGWNVEGLLAPRGEDAGLPADLPQLLVEDCRVELSDARGARPPVTETLRRVRLELRPVRAASASAAGGEASGTATRRFRFEARLAADTARRAFAQGEMALGPETVALDGRLRTFKLDLEAALLRCLPSRLAAAARRLGLRGVLDATVGFRLDGDGFRCGPVRASVVRGEARIPGVPLPVRGVRGEFRLAGGAGELSLEGELGDGVIEARATTEIDPATLTLRDWEGSAVARGVHLDRRTVERAEGEVGKWLRRFRPRGRIGFEVAAAAGDGVAFAPESLRAVVRLQGTELLPRRFPYPLTDCRVVVRYEDGWLRAEPGGSCRAGSGRASLELLQAEGRPGTAVDVVVMGRDIALDERARDACPPPVRRIWDDLRPRGRVDARVRLWRPRIAPDAPREERELRLDLRVTPRGVAIRHRSFPFGVRGIDRGEVRLDSREDTCRLRGLEGDHAGHPIRGEGRVDFGPRGSALELELEAPDLTIDDALVDALPEPRRQLVRDFNLRGRIAVDATVVQPRGGEPSVEVGVEVLEGHLRHARFPYPLELAGGELHATGFDRVELRDMRTAGDASPSVEFDGEVKPAGDATEVTFDFDVGRLALDDALRDALPARLQRAVRHAGLSGTFSGRLEGTYTYHPGKPAKNVFSYHGREVRSSDAGVDFGLRVAGIRGTGSFDGVAGPGDRHRVEGSIRLEEARFGRFNVRRVAGEERWDSLGLDGGRIRFAFGTRHPLVDDASPRTAELPPPAYSLPETFRRRLLEDTHDTIQASLTSDAFYGGGANGFLYIGTGERRDFAGDFTARRLDVARASRDVFGVADEGVGGEARGWVRFRGRVGDWKSIRGEGVGHMRDARLAEIPLFHDLLDLLSLGSRGAVFRKLSIPYEIRNGAFHSDEIDIESSLLALHGGGALDFRGRLDLLLQPVFVDVRVPILDDIFHLVKKVVSELEVEGTLADPQVEFRTVGVGIPIGERRAGADRSR